MRGLLRSIVVATFLASCSGRCQQGLNGKQDWYECEGLNDLNLQIPPTAAGISITKSNISKINKNAFSNFTNSLVQLNITGCGVEEIEPDAFRGLDKLQVLGLASNKIRYVQVSWIGGLSDLKKLDLSGNGNVSIDCRAEYLMPKIAGNVHINRQWCAFLNALERQKILLATIIKCCEASMPGHATPCCPYGYVVSSSKKQVRPLKANVSEVEGYVVMSKKSRIRRQLCPAYCIPESFG